MFIVAVPVPVKVVEMAAVPVLQISILAKTNMDTDCRCIETATVNGVVAVIVAEVVVNVLPELLCLLPPV